MKTGIDITGAEQEVWTVGIVPIPPVENYQVSTYLAIYFPKVIYLPIYKCLDNGSI